MDYIFTLIKRSVPRIVSEDNTKPYVLFSCWLPIVPYLNILLILSYDLVLIKAKPLGFSSI